jgi:hypothetical protein
LQATVAALQTEVAAGKQTPTSVAVALTLAPTRTASRPSPTQPLEASATLPPTVGASSPTEIIASDAGFPVSVESEHPYDGNFDDTWLISSPDPTAGATRIHISRIELEKNVDWLIIMDAKDAEMQRLTGSHLGGLWSEPVPGNLVKLRLVSDGSVQSWGFSVDRAMSVPHITLAYSPHPYPANARLKWEFNNTDPGAQGTRLHFSRIDLEENVDWLLITDLAENTYQWITGHHPDGLWTLGVPGNGIKVKLVTDSTVGDWGFNLDRLESAPPEAAQQRPERKESLAESSHPFELRSWTLVNTNPNAAFTKVHFARLHTAGGGLVLLDGNGNDVQAFWHKENTEDLWSDDVPGRVVKIEMREDSGGNGWGFRIDQLVDGDSKASLAESAHPFVLKPEAWTLINPNASATFTKVHFARLHTAGGGVVLLDGNNNEVQAFWHKENVENVWSDDIPGRVVKIEIREDSGSNGWGFRIDEIVDGEP